MAGWEDGDKTKRWREWQIVKETLVEDAGARAKGQIYGQSDDHIGLRKLRNKNTKSSERREEDGGRVKCVCRCPRKGNCVTCLQDEMLLLLWIQLVYLCSPALSCIGG